MDNTKRQKQPLFIRQGETATEVAIICIHGAGQAFYRIATVACDLAILANSPVRVQGYGPSEP